MVKGAWTRNAVSFMLTKMELDSRSRGYAAQLEVGKRDKSADTRREKKRVRKYKQAEARRRNGAGKKRKKGR